MKATLTALTIFLAASPSLAHTQQRRAPADTCHCPRATVRVVPATGATRSVKPCKPANTVPKRPPVEAPHPPFPVPVEPPTREVHLERHVIREIEREREACGIPSSIHRGESRTGLVLGLLGAVALGAVIASCGDDDGARVSVSVGGGASPKPAPGDCKPGKKKHGRRK